MTHKDLYTLFEAMFMPSCTQPVEKWFENGKNSIRVRMKDGQEYIFTFKGRKNWIFETMDSYVTRTKSKDKHVTRVRQTNRS